MSTSLGDEITKTTVELTELEKQRNKYRADMETLGLFSWPSMAVNREKYSEKFLYANDNWTGNEQVPVKVKELIMILRIELSRRYEARPRSLPLLL